MLAARPSGKVRRNTNPHGPPITPITRGTTARPTFPEGSLSQE